MLRLYLKPLKDKKIDTLILGCTHYQIVFSQIVKTASRRVCVLNPGDTVAKSLQNYLDRHPEIEKNLVKGTAHQYYATEITEIFLQNAPQDRCVFSLFDGDSTNSYRIFKYLTNYQIYVKFLSRRMVEMGLFKSICLWSENMLSFRYVQRKRSL